MVGKGAADELFDVVGRSAPSAGQEGPDASDGTEEVEIVLRVHVQPGAGRSAVVGRHGDTLKVKVAAAPEGGRANEAVLELLASTLGVHTDAVWLVSGQSSRSKRFRIGPVELGTARRLLIGATAGDSAPRRGGGAAAGNAKGVRGVR